MTKKDYELMADLINKDIDYYSHVDKNELPEPVEVLTSLANWFVEALEDDNPRFDQTKFLQACGIEIVMHKGVKTVKSGDKLIAI